MSGLAEDFRQTVAQEFHNMHRHIQQVEQKLESSTWDFDTGQSGSTNAAGFLDLGVWVNSTNRPVKLARILIWADGFSPASQYSAAGGWLGVFSGAGNNFATIRDFAPYVAGNPFLPNVANYSGANMPRFKVGEAVHVVIFGGPANTNITAVISGYSEPAGTQRII